MSIVRVLSSIVFRCVFFIYFTSQLTLLFNNIYCDTRKTKPQNTQDLHSFYILLNKINIIIEESKDNPSLAINSLEDIIIHTTNFDIKQYASFALGKIYSSKFDYKNASLYFSQSYYFVPSSLYGALILLHLSKSLAQLDKKEEALQILIKIITECPASPEEKYAWDLIKSISKSMNLSSEDCIAQITKNCNQQTNNDICINGIPCNSLQMAIGIQSSCVVTTSANNVKTTNTELQTTPNCTKKRIMTKHTANNTKKVVRNSNR